MDKYNQWIINNGYNVPEKAQGKCIEVVAKMIQSFPELEKRSGVVFSFENLDNFENYTKQYPHCWCINQEKIIIDPTKSQFILLGQLHYKEFNPESHVFKCAGCGQYFEGVDYYCGLCEWSKNE